MGWKETKKFTYSQKCVAGIAGDCILSTINSHVVSYSGTWCTRPKIQNTCSSHRIKIIKFKCFYITWARGSAPHTRTNLIRYTKADLLFRIVFVCFCHFDRTDPNWMRTLRHPKCMEYNLFVNGNSCWELFSFVLTGNDYGNAVGNILSSIAYADMRWIRSDLTFSLLLQPNKW